MTEKNREKETKVDLIPMVERAIRIVEMIFTKGEAIGVSELAAQLELPKATVYRILMTMLAHGYIERDEKTEKYSLGYNFIKIGEYVKTTVDARKIAMPYMQQLVNDTGENAYLCKLYNDEALILEIVNGETSSMYSMVTPSIPLYCSALGRSLMVDFSDEQIDRYVREKGLPKRTISTIDSKEALKREIEIIREKGVGIEVEEYEYGMMCIAGPIRNRQGELIGSMSVSGPTSRIRHKGEAEIVKKVRQACQEMMREIQD